MDPYCPSTHLSKPATARESATSQTCREQPTSTPSANPKRNKVAVTTSSQSSPAASGPRARAQDGLDDSSSETQPQSQASPALSTASTADGDEDIESSPALPPLPAPVLPGRVAELLRTPPPEAGEFGTASWGSPYPQTDANLRRQSFSSELSDDSPIHHLNIATPFLRQLPDTAPSEPESQTPISAAAAVLANRARRRQRGLTEDWIRTHTTGIVNAEPKHWFSDGSDSEHSSLSGSDLAWFADGDLRTPKPNRKVSGKSSKSRSRRPRSKSSLETLRPGLSISLKPGEIIDMAANADPAVEPAFEPEASLAADKRDISPTVESPEEKTLESAMGEIKRPATPAKGSEKPLPKEPVASPRLKKKVPWKGKNIMISLPRDDRRGQPGGTPMPLRAEETERMFESWKELGYPVNGFDLMVDGPQPQGTANSQSRLGWPDPDELKEERSAEKYQVILPDLNAWSNYVNELQEAKLRALGVSIGDDEPQAPSTSPPTTNPSRQPSAQYPPLPFSPPVPTSSASSNQIPGYPFPGQFIPAAQSPGLPTGSSPVPFATVPGKFNPRQSISLPTGNSPFQLSGHSPQAWQNQSGLLHGLNRHDSPSLANLSGILSPQSPYGLDGLQQAVSPSFNVHNRHQSLQYFPQQMGARASPRLQDVREEDELANKSPSKTPEPLQQQNPESLQAEIDDAEYHLEEQLRNQLEHEDYNPQNQGERPAGNAEQPTPAHARDDSGNAPVAERFAQEPGKPLVLHHPRPHSRGHSLSQNFFRDHDETQGGTQAANGQLSTLNDIPEQQKGDEAFEIETNPSNLGTPVQDFDFAAALGHHQKALSNTSNPWQDNVSTTSTRRSSHGSKPSLSGLNVQAPEFKFNPASTFTPGLFNFSGNNFQPAVFQAGNVMGSPANSVSQHGGSGRFHATAPSFSPGQTDFSFSTSGPKFRPDAPSFTPFQSVSGSVTSPIGSGSDSGKRNSIFGNINVQTSDIVKPVKKSKAIPIVRPSSRSSAKSVEAGAEADDLREGDNGRLTHDESRVKRAKSEAPGGNDVPLFAERPSDDAHEDHSGVEDEVSALEEGDNALPVDTSISSITTDHMDTQATTAAPSETSPAVENGNWTPFEFDSKVEAQNFSEAQAFGDHGLGEHKKSMSATAEPFVPGGAWPSEEGDEEKTVEPEEPVAQPREPSPPVARRTITPKGLGASRFASPPPKPQGLAGSRFAREPSPVEEPHKPVSDEEIIKSVEGQDVAPSAGRLIDIGDDREPTFEEIDAVMQHLETDPSMGVNKTNDTNAQWQRAATAETEIDVRTQELQAPADHFASDGAVVMPRQYHDAPDAPPMLSTELEDPFVDPPISPRSPNPDNEFDEPQIESEIASDWEGAFSDDEHDKLASRAQFFDGRVNEIVGSLLASRLEPLERSLSTIQLALAPKSRRAPSSRRDMRSMSAEFQESDADDEDDDLPLPRRSASPRRDRRMEFIKAAVIEALGSQERQQSVARAEPAAEESTVFQALEEMKAQVTASLQARAEEQDRATKQDAEIRKLLSARPDEQLLDKVENLQTRLAEAEERLQIQYAQTEKETTERRAAEDAASELHRKLQNAETRVEVEIINRSVFDQRVADLEDRLRQQEDKTEDEVKIRRSAEDRLSEVQRLLRISSEEENRLRDVVEEREQKIKSLEQAGGKSAMRMTLLEAAQTNSSQSQTEMTNKTNALEADLRNVRQDNNHWRAEAERADEAARRKSGELAYVMEENKHMQKTLNTLATQLEENERLRETWRTKFLSLQDDMAKATRDIAEENARRIKRDQTMLARQEVLDARLQAEAKTRERLEVEMERLQMNERSGMRAVNENKRLEGLLSELRTENHKLQQAASRYQREFEEARESGASEVRRTRMALQTEVDAANHQVNVIREELEEQNSKLRSELDNVKLEADTAKAQSEMLLEEAQTTKATELEELKRKHENDTEDMQARYERQVNNATEDAQRTEQQLLERLSLSSSKIEHLQDRIVHLEDKLEIAKEAAAAAAQAAKSAGVEPGPAATVIAAQPRAVDRSLDPPEKISPQALRESIMVLQEQLQAREQRIEELEQTVAKSDPEAASKISKRDDEISWLRELLSVRHGDLQDIITALSGDSYNREAVKDAAIRLKANLQMEEQERERAMNGGSAINLPNIAQTIQAATPRVAQAVGPIAAAWGSWRKSSQPSFRSISAALNSPAGSNATPSKSRGVTSPQNSLLGGLLTPPASGLRQTPPADNRPQPTAFASTGRRYTSQSSAPLRPRGESTASRRSDVMPSVQSTPPRQHERREQPQTPPMSGYDSDAQPGDFDDHDFFEED
ncbi:myosin class II heavy chain (MHC) [Purpureocillium lavendulum]|uniref:Myosin class II heavy chain (MHC) n=1 Tax=Purpureocillium lavendulum TaxID=1247861 RepID=A0AB34G0U7_9HYPO|nr:myosin class II heavy chain (MHC) [Purpureocillium lavendulum]